MNSQTRLLNTIRGLPADRVPVKTWGVDPTKEPRNESFRPLHELAWLCDQMPGWGPKGLPAVALNAHPEIELTVSNHSSRHAGYVEDIHVLTAGGRRFESRFLRGLSGEPGMISKHMIESPEAMRDLLALPFRPFQPPVDDFLSAQDRLGTRGVLMAMLPSDPIYQLQILLGSERLAMWSVEERDTLRSFLKTYGSRWHEYAAYLQQQGVGPLFGYVGPELGIPPLLSFSDFEEFVFDIEKPVLDTLHAGGGLVWVHCHGRMRGLLERFAAMGVDCLNPIEPPPMGDITMAEAKSLVGQRMTLEGNLEIGDFADLTPDAFRAVCERTMREGKPGGRFIFGQSSDPSHWLELPPRVLENYRIFVEVGLSFGRF